MSVKYLRLWLVCLTLLACVPTGGGIPAATVPEGPPICRQSTVDAISALHAGLEFPDRLMAGEAPRPGEDFDAHDYFSILKHLSMEPGYVLDYVYFYEQSGGEPLLYARKKDEPSYATYSDFYDETQITINSEKRYNYLEHIQVDGTAEGFYEFVVLRVMGGQFYLFWHANYNDLTVLCDSTGLEAIIATLELLENPLTEEQKEKVRQLGVEPVVEFETDTVKVKVVTFTRWGGFVRTSYSIERAFPHRIVWNRLETTTLVPYDIGLEF